MKLHLPQGLRRALLVCISGLSAVGTTVSTGAIAAGTIVATLAGQALADPSAEEIATYETTLSGSDANEVHEGKVYNMSVIGDTGEIFLKVDNNIEGADHQLFVAKDSSITVSEIDADQGATVDYTKLGEGLLEITTRPNVQRAKNITVAEGTLKLSYGYSDVNWGIAFAEETVAVHNGATLHLAGGLLLGRAGSNNLPTITLGGGESTGVATMTIDAETGIYSTLKVNGKALINGSGVLTIDNTSRLQAGDNGWDTLTIGGSATVKFGNNYGDSAAFSSKNVNIAAGGRLELTGAWRNANYTGILAGDVEKDVKGGVLAISTTSAGWGGNDITMDSGFYGILEITHGGLEVTKNTNTKLGNTYQINLASSEDGSADGSDNPGSFLIFGDKSQEVELTKTVNINSGKYGAVTVQNQATGTIKTLTGAGTLVLRGYTDNTLIGTFDGTLKISDISAFSGSIDMQQGKLELTSTSGYTMGSASSLKTAAGTTLTTAGNLTLAGTSEAQATHRLFGDAVIGSNGSGKLTIANALVYFGSDQGNAGGISTNTLKAAEIEIQSGGVFKMNHTADATNFANTNLTLSGGELKSNDMGGVDASNPSGGTTFNTLTVTAESALSYDYKGAFNFSSLTGAGTLNVWGGSEQSKTTIALLNDYTGTLRQYQSDHHKLYINSANLTDATKTTIIEGTSYSEAGTSTDDATPTGFVKTGNGGLTMGTHYAEGNFSVQGGNVTIKTLSLGDNATLSLTSGSLKVSTLELDRTTLSLTGGTFTGTDAVISGTVSNTGNFALTGTISLHEHGNYEHVSESYEWSNVNKASGYQNYNSYIIKGTKGSTLDLSGVTLSSGLTWQEGDNSLIATANDGIYHVNTDMKYSDDTAMREASSIVVKNSTLQFEGNDWDKGLQLNNGTFIQPSEDNAKGSLGRNSSVTLLGGDNKITAVNSSLYGNISGTGSLTLEVANHGGDGFYIKSTISHKGDLTLQRIEGGSQNLYLDNTSVIKNEGAVTLSSGHVEMRSGATIDHSTYDTAGSLSVTGGSLTALSGSTIKTKQITVSGEGSSLRIEGGDVVAEGQAISLENGGKLVLIANDTLTGLTLKGGNVVLAANSLSGSVKLAGGTNTITNDARNGSTFSSTVTSATDKQGSAISSTLSLKSLVGSEETRKLNVTADIQHTGDLALNGNIHFQEGAEVANQGNVIVEGYSYDNKTVAANVQIDSGVTFTAEDLMINSGKMTADAALTLTRNVKVNGGTLEVNSGLTANGVSVAAGAAIELATAAQMAIKSLELKSDAELVLGTGTLSFTASEATTLSFGATPFSELAPLSLADDYTTASGTTVDNTVNDYQYAIINLSGWSDDDVASLLRGDTALFSNVAKSENWADGSERVMLTFSDNSVGVYDLSLSNGSVFVSSKVVPEPTTATLSLLALAALAARRRRK